MALPAVQRLTRTTGQAGWGVGLSIVAAIATAHGAALHAEPPPSGGLDILVSFPPPQPEPDVMDHSQVSMTLNRYAHTLRARTGGITRNPDRRVGKRAVTLA